MCSDWPVTDFEWSGSLATDHDAHLLFMYWLLDGSTRSKVWVLYSVNTLKSELCSWWAGITWRMVTNIHIHQNMYMYIYIHMDICAVHISLCILNGLRVSSIATNLCQLMQCGEVNVQGTCPLSVPFGLFWMHRHWTPCVHCMISWQSPTFRKHPQPSHFLWF